MNKWNETEISFLKENYKNKGAKYCSEKLNREIYAVRRKANLIGLSSSNNKGIYDKDFLEHVIINSKTFKECLIKMNLRYAGGNYKVLKSYIEKYNLDISHFETSSDRIRNVSELKKTPIEECLVENSSFSRTQLKARLYKEGFKNRECEDCGQGEEWKGKKMSLILDHINGIWNDNRLENLRILCPNCNATLDTHAGKKLKKKYYCECGNDIGKNSTICTVCANNNKRKADRPPLDILLKEVSDFGYSATGRKYNVSDNAIRKWIKKYKQENKNENENV